MAQVKLANTKRPNYFTGQLLGEEDFKSEQAYHNEMRRHQFRTMHTWGVAEGLMVEKQGDRAVRIEAGSAVDRFGNEIILDGTQTITLTEFGANTTVYLTIGYEEGFEPSDRGGDEAQGYTRITQFAVIQDLNTGTPAADGSIVVLARIQIDGNRRIATVDNSVKQFAGTKIAERSIDAGKLMDSAVTAQKLHPSLRSGWVRLPFKPSPFAEPQQDQKAREFFIGATRTYCDSKGAKGTMAIPAPPLYNRVKTLVVAGDKNDGVVRIELHRCGWDPVKSAHERLQLLSEELVGAPFHKSFSINKPLSAETHALALFLEATNEANISLIAAEFEYVPERTEGTSS
jgi:hypothetical protein